MNPSVIFSLFSLQRKTWLWVMKSPSLLFLFIYELYKQNTTIKTKACESSQELLIYWLAAGSHICQVCSRCWKSRAVPDFWFEGCHRRQEEDERRDSLSRGIFYIFPFFLNFLIFDVGHDKSFCLLLLKRAVREEDKRSIWPTTVRARESWERSQLFTRFVPCCSRAVPDFRVRERGAMCHYETLSRGIGFCSHF